MPARTPTHPHTHTPPTPTPTPTLPAVAAQLLIPYLGWVSFATALTINIMQNNPKVSGARRQQKHRWPEGGGLSCKRMAVKGKDAARETAGEG